MTNDKAVKLLQRIADEQFDGEYGDERREALEMAVRALESNLVKESGDLVKDLVEDSSSDLISRQETIEYCVGNKTWHDEDRATGDTIYRQAAIDAVVSAMIDGADAELVEGVMELLPSAQPERLTDDDFEAIRIHLNAYKEKLCNQHRWKEAEEYQRIIDRFMAFASALQEYEPVTAEEFAKTMSENTLYQYMAWHGEALALMKEQGFVICKKAM